MMILGIVLWMVLLGILGWTLIRWWEYRATLPEPRRSGSGFSALEILRQRYARGEIDISTFEQMHKRLEGLSASESSPEKVSTTCYNEHNNKER